MTTTARAAIYVRISRDREGAGLGVERQVKECRALAERLGWDVAEVYVDNDISAYSGKKRPRYLAMLDAIKAGQIDAVLAWHTDRLHRSPTELEHYIDVCSSGGRDVPTQCVTAGLLDLTNASGRMTARITGAVARHESEHKSERIKSKFAQSRAAGEWPAGGRRVFGYRSNGEIDPVEGALFRDGVQRLLAGESLRSIAARWRAAGSTASLGAEWTGPKLKNTFRHPRRAGFLSFDGKIVGRGNWEPIITDDEYYAVCAILDARRKGPRDTRTRLWLGSGLYICGPCGAVMRIAGFATGRKVYRCTTGRDGPSGAGHSFIEARPLDEHVRATTCLVLDKEGPDLLDSPSGVSPERLAELRSAMTAAQTRINQLGEMFAADEITRDEWVATKALCVARLETATTALDTLIQRSPLDGVADAPHPGEAFLALPVERQWQVVDWLMTVTVNRATRPGRRPKGRPELDIERLALVPQERFAGLILTSPAAA